MKTDLLSLFNESGPSPSDSVKEQFSYTLLDAQLTPSLHNLNTFLGNLKRALKSPSTLIILKGPQHSKKSIETQLDKLSENERTLISTWAQDNQSSLMGFFSSGSTGNPKLIIHRQSSLLSSAKISGELLKLSSNTPLFSSLPFYHVGGFLCLIRQLYFQCPFHWVESVNLQNEIENVKVNKKVIVGVPAQIKRISSSNPKDRLTFYAGGDKVTSDHWKYGQNNSMNLISTYGQTESCGALLYKDNENLPIKVFKDVSLDFEQTKDGDLLCYQTPRICQGVIENSVLFEVNPKAFYETSDLVKREGNSITTFIGRKDEQFQCGGEMISPKALEGYLKDFLKVFLKTNSENFTVKVLGIPHERLGQIPVGFIKELDSKKVEEFSTYLMEAATSDNSPARLRALALWPVLLDKKSGIKPAYKDFLESFHHQNWPL